VIWLVDLWHGAMFVTWALAYAFTPVLAVVWLACALVSLHDEVHKAQRRRETRGEHVP
jgi:hypothetical protein